MSGNATDNVGVGRCSSPSRTRPPANGGTVRPGSRASSGRAMRRSASPGRPVERVELQLGGARRRQLPAAGPSRRHRPATWIRRSRASASPSRRPPRTRQAPNPRYHGPERQPELPARARHHLGERHRQRRRDPGALWPSRTRPRTSGGPDRPGSRASSGAGTRRSVRPGAPTTSWSYTFAVPANGSYAIEARADDAAGNFTATAAGELHRHVVARRTPQAPEPDDERAVQQPDVLARVDHHGRERDGQRRCHTGSGRRSRTRRRTNGGTAPPGSRRSRGRVTRTWARPDRHRRRGRSASPHDPRPATRCRSVPTMPPATSPTKPFVNFTVS